MAAPDALRRLGGGRWETKDGRFQIEPQSGTWVIVDTTQTNEFGLPLVRGPFGSLGAAREAIDSARSEPAAESPLSERIEKSRMATPADPSKAGPTKSGPKKSGPTKAPTGGSAPVAEPSTPAQEPKPSPEPRWLRALGTSDHKRAKRLITNLEELGIADSEAIVRAEFVEGEPALARLALERRLQDAIESAKNQRAAVLAAIEAILSGEDDDLGAQWRLVDGRGRRIEKIDLPD